AVRGSAIVLAFAVAVLAAAVLRTSAHGRAPVAIETVLDIPPIPGDVARALTFGFRSLLADFTLLQAIQVLPSRHADMTPGFAAAADLPHAPAFVGLLATRLAAQAGDLQIATSLAEAMLAHANEEATRKEWQDRVDALHMERDLRAIEEAAQRYREEKGVLPRSVHALAAAGFLPAAPREPHGGRYVLEGDGSARSTATERLHAYGLETRFEIHR